MDIDSVLKGHGIGIGGSNIKSIQRGITNLVNAVTKTIAISNMDRTKTIVKISMKGCLYNDASNNCVEGYLSNSTTLTLNRQNATDTSDCIVEWELIEFNNVKSFQEGDKVFSASGDTTVAISAVNTLNSSLFCSINASGGTNIYNAELGSHLTNSTTITFSKSDATVRFVHWQVIEFN